MKYFCVILLLFIGVACSDESLPSVLPTEFGTWTDPDDGITYGWVRIGELEWMTSNLKAGIPYFSATYDLTKYGSNLYLDFSDTKEKETADFNEYGNLYEWRTACQVCANLKDGWRLPTDEDWQKLEMAFGMSEHEVKKTGWRGKGVVELLQQGDDGSGFNLQMAGCWLVGDSHYMRVRYVAEKGFYWTASQDADGKIYYRKLHYNSSCVFRSSTDSLSVPAMRIRCVRDVR